MMGFSVVISGSASGCSGGKVQVGPDLNAGAGGNYIYWCVEWGTPPMYSSVINGLTLTQGACPGGYTRLDSDLNSGAGGAYIYFCYKHGSMSSGITDATVGNSHTAGWNWNGQDLNQGAGGAFLYVGYNQCGDAYHGAHEWCNSGTGCSQCRCTGGYFYNGNGCSACGAGQYSETQSSGNPVCISCSPGKYSSSGSSSCPNCPGGKYSGGGASSCTQCNAGKYSSSGWTECSDCAPGKYASSNGRSSCSTCPGGKYSGTGHSSCPLCAAGKYSGSGWSQCAVCGAGKYAESGSSSCKNCACGKASSAEAGSCYTCPSGRYSGSTSSTCHDCDVGVHSPSNGACSCSNCGYGYHQNEGGRNNCKGCSAGRFTDSGANVECKLCDAGRYSPPTQSACPYCPAGTYSPQQQAQIGTTCPECSPGRYSGVGQANSCPICPAGRWTGTRYEHCVPCAIGRYGPTPELSTCTDCPVGRYQGSTDQADCIDCPTGRYMPNLKAAICTQCQTGRYQDQLKTTVCKLCPAGRAGEVVELHTAACSHPCQAGWYCPIESVSRWQVECGKVDRYCPTESPYWTLVDIGYYTTPENVGITIRQSQTVCPAGQWCRNGVRRDCYSADYCGATGYSTSTRIHLLWDSSVMSTSTSGNTAGAARAWMLDDILAIDVVDHNVNNWAAWLNAGTAIGAGGGKLPEQLLFMIPILTSSLSVVSDADTVHLRRQIQKGATLIMHGDPNGHAIEFLNRLMHWSLVAGGTAAAGSVGSRVDGDPHLPSDKLNQATVTVNNPVYTTTTASLPGNATRLYNGAGGEWIWEELIGVGRIVYFGGTIDFDALPGDWTHVPRETFEASTLERTTGYVLHDLLWHLRPGVAAPMDVPRVDLLWDTTGRLFDTGFASRARHMHADLLTLGHEVHVRHTDWVSEAVPDTWPEKSIIVWPAMYNKEPRAINIMTEDFLLPLQKLVAAGSILVFTGDEHHNSDEIARLWYSIGYAHIDDNVRPGGEDIALNTAATVDTGFEAPAWPADWEDFHPGRFAKYYSLGQGSEFVFEHDFTDPCLRTVFTGPPSGDNGWAILKPLQCGAVVRLAFDWSVSGAVRGDWCKVLDTAILHFHELDSECVAPPLKCELQVAAKQGEWLMYDKPTDVDAMALPSPLSRHANVRCFVAQECVEDRR